MERPTVREAAFPLVLSFLLYLSLLVRLLLLPPDEGTAGPLSYALMAAVLAVGIAQVTPARRWRPLAHVAMGVQTILVIGLFLTEPSIDYYGILFVALSVFASRDVEPPGDVIWLGILCAGACFGLIAGLSPAESLQYIPTYVAACLLLGLYGRANRRSVEARARSDALRADLETANRRLRALAQQAEEAAAAEERARLSRELHDAATQTVFSISLTATAARAALAEEPAAAAPLLERLEVLARDALAELRALVKELRPQGVAELGLVHALEQHVETRRRRDGMSIRFAAEGGECGSVAVRQAVYSAAVEALNNVAKHSGVTVAEVELAFGPGGIALRVMDRGRGFSPGEGPSAESLGLVAMRERVEALHGSLAVTSAPGQGTVVEVTLPPGEGESHA